jgi:DNA repair protein RadA/Sms
LKKLSFKKIIIPASNAKNIAFDPEIKIDAVKNIAEFVKIILN